VSQDLASLDGRIELRGLLGSGGMGEVHRAWDRTLERPVAVKFVFSQDARDTERLLLEARLQARVEHPHVVQVHEVGSLGGRPCIVLQLVEGQSLGQLGPELSVTDRVELMRQAGLGLHAAHAQGLVHRDVKPANVLVEQGAGGTPHALLTDFGLARGDEPGLTRSGLPAGTLDYMSPEQLLAPGPADFRSDIYALGATLYAVLAGHPPFRRRAPSASTGDTGADGLTLQRLLEEEPEPLTRAAPDVPRELGLIVGRAMERQPADRYPSAEAFSEDLGRQQRGEPILARPLHWTERSVRWARRNRGITRSLAVAVLALLIAGGWTLWSRRRADRAALEAARLGALAESMEATLRMEHLGPPHDLRPALTRVRAEAERLRPLARGGDGPANLALGKALQLTGDLDGARQAYEAAWRSGFHPPRLAEDLGVVLGELYRKGYQRARETLAPEAREARFAALSTELREPAMRYLSLSDAAGWRGDLLRASQALLEWNYPEARKQAAAVVSAEPSQYEALTLGARAWIDEGRDLSNAQKLDAAAPALVQGAEVLQKAAQWGRSDPDIARARAQVHALQANLLTLRGQSPEAELQSMLAALDDATVLDPDDPSTQALRGVALLQRAQYLFMSNATAVPAVLEAGIAAYRRAVDLGADDARTLCQLGRGLYYQAFRLHEEHKPSLAQVREGLAAANRAAARAPEDPEVPFIQCMLHATEGDALELAGQPTLDARRASVEAGQRAVAMHAARSGMLRPIMGQQLVLLGRDAWFDGQDPRPHFQQARQVFEEALKALPGQPAPAAQFAQSVDVESDILWELGEDPQAEVDAAAARIDDVLQRAKGLAFIEAIKAEVLAGQALRRAGAGQDPGPFLDRAGPIFERLAPSMGPELSFVVSRGMVALAEAEWQASRGIDPSPSLDRAERRVTVLGAGADNDAAQEFLARCSLERARWLARQRRSAEAVARQGLGQLEVALRTRPRDPTLKLLEARLRRLAGDHPGAEQALGAALAVNPLLHQGVEARLAQAEVRSP
jgi:eukaryotic-like serine/threonine-protein kinase